MAKFCPRCGKEIPDVGHFCPFCSADVENPSSWQGGFVGPEIRGGMSGKMKAVILGVIVVIVVVISVVMFLFVFGNSLSEGDLVGSWDVEMTMSGYNQSGSYIWNFDDDGSLEIIYFYSDPSIHFESDSVMNTLTVSTFGSYSVSNATWEIDEGKLCINPESSTSLCFDYEVNGDTVELTGGYGIYKYIVTMTKRDDDGVSGYVIEWKDINISVSPYYASEIQYDWIKLTRVPGVPYSGAHAPEAWGYVQEGDVIQIADMYTSVSISGEFVWVPNGETIDWFSV